MTLSVYTDKDGYIGEISAPDLETAVSFLKEQGYEPGTYSLWELYGE